MIAVADDPALLHDLLVVAVPSCLAAGAAITAAWIAQGARRESRRTGRVAKEAAETAVEYAETGNGKTLGETAHDTNQTVELLAAMIHTNTKETILLGSRLGATEEVLASHVAEAGAVHARMNDYLDTQEALGEQEAP